LRPSTLLLGLGLLLATSAVAGPADGVRNDLGMRFVEIPAGTFQMGTADLGEAVMLQPEPKPGKIRDETPQHRVRISQPFYLGRTEVTQGQWQEVMGTRPGPEAYWARDDWRRLPVVSVSWTMAQRFIDKLNARDEDWRYRLPTEAEWEYAARGGTEGLWPWPQRELEAHAWFINNSGDRPHPVASLEPNGFGLYDMTGNVWEWTADWYRPDAYTEGLRIDPAGPDTGQNRVRRGGSYHCPLHLTRVARRSANAPDTAYSVIGFRLVAEPR